MSIRLRGNTKHTQRNGWEPGEITVEWTGEEDAYEPHTIADWTQYLHAELQDACDRMNGGPTITPPTRTSMEHQS